MMIRRTLLPFFVGLVLAISAASTATAAPTPTSPTAGFLESFDDAVALSKKTDSPILVSLYATWCGWCRKLDNEVFPSPAFRAFAEQQGFVLLRLDTEDGAAGSALTARYDTSGVPNTLVLDPNLVKIAHVNGYAPPNEMVAYLGNQLDGWKTVLHHYDEVISSDDTTLQQKMARDFYQRGDGDRASKLFERLLVQVENGSDAEAWYTYLAADSHRLAGRFDRAAQLATKSRTLAEDLTTGQKLGELREQVDLLSFYIAQDQGDCPQAVHSLETFLEAHPKSSMRPNLKRALDRLKQDAACT